ncbi:hypothetical protein GCM10029976_044010 [Kribbella albertanoniae]|uniref:Uncharacterized protein n=1 Tax=Kribbella albertanoniae TaxID=1266829 RepID=A0A4R4P387_9ACTN|nr:hypothetical protein [Kribbella albertanoniae]TDC16359.1 hypothetical protein E1261_39110 [Kribbella albertanoniae]
MGEPISWRPSAGRLSNARPARNPAGPPPPANAVGMGVFTLALRSTGPTGGGWWVVADLQAITTEVRGPG